MEEEILSCELARFRQGKDIIAFSGRNKVYRELMIMIYANEILKKRLVRIQDLSQERKKELWSEVRKEFPSLGVKEGLQMAKIIYLISENL